MQVNVGDYEKPDSLAQVEDEYTRMELLALSYWMRYELFLGIRNPFDVGDEMERKMADLMRRHEERKNAIKGRTLA